MSWPPEKIEEVRLAADILLVIGEAVSLKRRGKNWVGLCPFHTEKTPSFTVAPDKGLFKCFGCGRGGDVFTFVMEYERVSFPEAVRLLAERFGVPLPDPDPRGARSRDQEALYEALREAMRFFSEQLRARSGKRAQNYLRRRGISERIAQRFGLGYAPAGWDALARHVQAMGLDPDPFVRTNLLLPRKDGTYVDRFRDRLMFPITSPSGKVIGFAGRLLQAIPNQPKYVNTAETPLYRKGEVLYGLYQAREAIRARDEALLVEGYADVLALHEYGFEEAVASGGTALTPEQARLLSRYTRRVTILFDGDEAGLRATLRALEMLLTLNFEVRVLRLPQGEDPDSFLRRQGREAFLAYRSQQERDFLHFVLEQELGGIDASTDPERQARTARLLLRLIGRIPDVLRRTAYVRLLASTLHLPEAMLQGELESHIARSADKPSFARPHSATAPGAESGPPTSPPGPPPPERLLLRLMLEYGARLVEHVFAYMNLEEFTHGPSRELAARLLQAWQAGEPIEVPRWMRMLERTPLGELMLEVLTERYDLSLGWLERRILSADPEPDPHEAAEDAIRRLKCWRLDRVIEENSRQIAERTRRGEAGEEEMRKLLERRQELISLRRDLEKSRFSAPHSPQPEPFDVHENGPGEDPLGG
jgi:DNA primase